MDIADARIPVQGHVPRGHGVIQEGESLVETSLTHGVDIDTQRHRAAPGAVEPFRTDATVHRFQHAPIDAEILVAGETTYVGHLQQRHGCP